MATFIIIAFLAWLVRKGVQFVNRRCAEIDFENSFMAGLREDIQEGKIQWPRS